MIFKIIVDKKVYIFKKIFWKSFFRFLEPSITPLSSITQEYPTFHFKTKTASELNKALLNFSSQAVGPDGIPLKVLKLAYPTIQDQILHLFNHSLKNAIFPEEWKICHILPIDKIPNPKVLSDYRPVSLLNMLSKIFEKCVSFQMMDHLISQKIIDPLQSGFRPGYSPETCLLKLTEDIKQNNAKKLITALISLILPKLSTG